MEIRQFTESSLEEAKSYIINKDLLTSRKLVKGFTIDGPTSKDLDDGINLYPKGENYLVQVSIADVAEAVRIDSELFDICLERLETRYLRDTNLPMLPKILSEHKLSLKQSRSRLAITFEFEITKEAEVLNFDIKETTFFSLAKLSYKKFDFILKSEEKSNIQKKFKILNQLSIKLLEKRRQKGALAIYDLQKGLFTNEEGTFVPINENMKNASYLVVQEFMILTNKLLAWFFAKNDIILLNRNHTAKQTAPNRTEILEQINTAIANPGHIISLHSRSQLWFNKATYSPIILGHFGLNEPIYSHVTSPIRRVADLINHHLIKAYIKNETTPFALNQLIELSNNINKGISEIKELKADMFKEKAIFSGVSKLNLYSEDFLSKLSNKDFNAILYSAVKTNTLKDNLKNVLLKKLKSKKIDLKIIYLILFKSDLNNNEWNEFRQIALEYINKKNGLSLQFLNIFVQQGFIDKYDSDIQQFEDGYKVKITAYRSGEIISPKYYSVSARKKDAISKATNKIIKILLDADYEEIEDDNELQNIEINDEVISIMNENIEEIKNLELLKDDKFQESNQVENNIQEVQSDTNYVGILLEKCQKNKNWKFSDYSINLSGLAHSPKITCSAILITPEMKIEASAVTTNKKTAKQEVARKILSKLDNSGNIEDENKISPPNSDVNNPVGNLQEFCMKNKLPLPEYIFNSIGTIHKPEFECEVKIIMNGNLLSFTETADNKKIAKQNCSAKCMEYLNDLSISALQANFR